MCRSRTTLQVRIETGEITHRLPSERDLAEEYGVAYQTVRHAMKLLRERGLIITRQGRGTFVAQAHRGRRPGEADELARAYRSMSPTTKNIEPRIAVRSADPVPGQQFAAAPARC